MASRRLEDLLPEVARLAEQHRISCLGRGIEILIYCTLREAEEQGRLFGEGRTAAQIQVKKEALRTRGYPELTKLVGPPKEGKRLTNAGPGESYHQYGRAYDCAPVVSGKLVWGTAGFAADLWEKVGKAGESVGLEWAARWVTFREFPHFQLTGGRSREDLMAERYGAAVGTRHVSPSLLAEAAIGDEGGALRALLAAPKRRVYVLASVAGTNDTALGKIEARAKVVAQWNPESWFVFRVLKPDALPADLRGLLWNQLPPEPVVTLGEGADLARKATPYALADADDPDEIFDAFTQA